MSENKLKAISPVSMKSRLMGNPTQEPLFSQECTLKSGEKIILASPVHNRALVALMDMQAVLGGAASHWGGPSAFAELMTAIYGLSLKRAQAQQVPWYEAFHLINDAGHCENGIYALKANYGLSGIELQTLKGFRSINSCLTGHAESHIFPESVLLSNGPLGSSFAQAQGLAYGDRLSKNSRVTVLTVSDGACMEGEAKEALCAIPGLAQKGLLNPFILVISDNNTKLSGRIDEQSFSMTPFFKSLKELGWKTLLVEKGNDLSSCLHAYEEALSLAQSDPQHPVLILAKTIKGYGVSATEKSSSGGHGFPLKSAQDLGPFIQEIFGDQKPPEFFLQWIEEMKNMELKKNQNSKKAGSPSLTEKVQVGVSQALIKKAKEGVPVFSISSDLSGSTGVAAFQKAFPAQFVDVGIAESNMVSMASGLAKQGFIPVVDTFAQFGVTKGALPLTMAALSQAPMIAIFSHVGFQDAADGASHQALTYYSMLGSIPQTDLFHLSCSEEAEALVGQAVDTYYQCLQRGETPRSSIFFLGRETFPPSYEKVSIEYQLFKSFVVFDNSDHFKDSVTIVASGACIFQAIQAAQALEKKSLSTIVINPSIINHPDIKTLSEALEKSQGRLLTVEEHQRLGGMASFIAHELSLRGYAFQLKSLAVQEAFGQSAYKANELYAKHGLDAASIERAALDLFS